MSKIASFTFKIIVFFLEFYNILKSIVIFIAGFKHNRIQWGGVGLSVRPRARGICL